MSIFKFRLIAGFLPLFLIATAARADPAAAPIVCTGSDMLAELQKSEPDAFRAIADRAKTLENAEALLWKIERNSQPASYLTGTMHLTDPRIATLSPKLLAALDQVKAVALEVADLSDAASSDAIGKAAGLLIYTDGQRLDALLSEDEFRKVRVVLSRAGMPGEIATVMKPWLISMLMAVSDCEREKVQKGGVVLDMKIADEAKARNIQVIGLETIESQLTALASLPETEQIDMLRAALKFSDRRDDMMETLIQMFVKRNMGAVMPMQFHMAKKAGVDETAFAGFQKMLLVDRNRGMVAGSVALMDNGPALIAVGALHLSGKEGLVALLRQQGFTVTPIE